MVGEIPSLSPGAAQRTDGDPRRRQEQRYPRRQAPRRHPEPEPETPPRPDDEPRVVGSRLNVTV